MRGWRFPETLVQRCFLWRVSSPKPTCFSHERRFILRSKRPPSSRVLPSRVDVPDKPPRRPCRKVVLRCTHGAAYSPVRGREAYIPGCTGRYIPGGVPSGDTYIPGGVPSGDTSHHLGIYRGLPLSPPGYIQTVSAVLIN